jgi:biotin operon repressor
MRPAGLIQENNSVFLNTCTRTALAPVSEPAVLGETGQFPWISKFLDVFFDPHEQLEFFLSWLSFFYQAVWHQEPRSGQNIFIAGNPNVGKTLLGTRIIAALVGGFSEGKEYLLGEDTFGSELFDFPLWCVDDATFTAEPKTRRRFSEMIKQMAANRKFRYHAKFRIPLMVEWQRRVIVTCNRDEQSIQMLPDLEISILDKIMFFKAADKTVEFPAPAELEAILQRELPFFARFLLDYQIPEQCKGDSRFGVKAYHEASLVQTAEQSSLTAEFSEILADWKPDYFNIQPPEAEFWEGTAYQLQKEISFSQQGAAAMRGYGRGAVGRALAALKNKGTPIECRYEKGKRIWRIYRPGAEPNEKANSNTANGKTSDVCPVSALETAGV